MTTIASDKFYALWVHLHRFAMAKGIGYHDAEDLVSAAIVKAIDAFDPAKGEVTAFCKTILYNLMKNYWRDRKRTDHLENEDDLVFVDPAFDMMESEEELRMTIKQLNRIMNLLTNEEKRFIVTLGEVLDELGSRGVSEAARRVGLSVAEGHSILQRVRRKAKRPTKTVRTLSSEESVATGRLQLREEGAQRSTDHQVLYQLSIPEIDSSLGIARAAAFQESCQRFVSGLTEHQQGMLWNALE